MSRPHDLSSGWLSWRSVVPWGSGPLRLRLRPLGSGPGPRLRLSGPGLLLPGPRYYIPAPVYSYPARTFAYSATSYPARLRPCPPLTPIRPKTTLSPTAAIPITIKTASSTTPAIRTGVLIPGAPGLRVGDESPG